MSWEDTAIARDWGVTGWAYNRANFKYDQQLRWQRFTTGRKMACAQVGMFRQDVTDLAGVTMGKLKVYGPIYGIVVTVCVTVLVEGRSGLKFPGPPVFISGVYLQCLAIGMTFMTLATWLLFHAAMRAQIACVQLRTRKVRVPVPTQRQLDNSRKFLSTWEEQGLYNMFRLPFVLPNGANSPERSEDEKEEEAKQPPKKEKGYCKGGMPGLAAKVKSKVQEVLETGAATHNARLPGFTPGNPSWFSSELEEYEDLPKTSPSNHGKDGPQQPFEHFELLRETQKEWWGAEAYMRVCFLYGMMHLVMSFAYWVTLHNIIELGMLWCANMGAAGMTAGVWLMFRMDVLPEYGGSFPVEIGGPFVTSVALGLMYAHNVNDTILDAGRGLGIVVIVMHILLTYRMYAIAKPTNGRPSHQAREAGGRLFNATAQCDAPSWLPSSFQHVMYLVAPPKTQQQLDQEVADRDSTRIQDDPLAKVDMMPWQYTRTVIFVVGVGWFVLLAGRLVELGTGERMLVTNPGQPPWSRTGQWYGWEHGPISSKHYAHVTPQRGHWAWQKGWGPQGQQELWTSDVFGFAPEADAWWAEDEGPEPMIGAAGLGENTWAHGRLAYGQNAPIQRPAVEHDEQSSGGHRRLSAAFSLARPVVPVPMEWPAMVEPHLLACGPQGFAGHVVALASTGMGAIVPPETMAGRVASVAKAFALEGSAQFGVAHSVSWGNTSLMVVTSSGAIMACPFASLPEGKALCSLVPAPPLPGLESTAGSQLPPAAVVENKKVAPLRAAVAHIGGRVTMLELLASAAADWPSWERISNVHIPRRASAEAQPEVVAVAVTDNHLLATADNGVTYQWLLRGGVPTSPEPVLDAPAMGSRHSWQSACALPDGKIMHLALKWQRAQGGVDTWRSELLL